MVSGGDAPQRVRSGAHHRAGIQQGHSLPVWCAVATISREIQTVLFWKSICLHDKNVATAILPDCACCRSGLAAQCPHPVGRKDEESAVLRDAANAIFGAEDL